MKSRLLIIFVLLISLSSLAYAIQIRQTSIHEAEKYFFPEEYVDLTIVDIIFEPENPIVGDTINVTAILTNYGNVGSTYSVSFGVETPYGWGFGGGPRPDPDNPLEPGEIEEFIFDFEDSGEGVYIVTVTLRSDDEDFYPDNNQREENITVS